MLKQKEQGPKANSGQLAEIPIQTGLQAILFALQKDETQREATAKLLMIFGKHNPMELFTDMLQQYTVSWSEYASLCQWLLLPQVQTDLGKETIQESGVMSFWVLQSLRVAEGPIDITLDDRIQSLVFLTEIWLAAPEFIQDVLESSGPGILSILKRASRDVKQTLSVVAIELMFRLLEQFATTRNPSAPTVYKTLTFLLVEFYWETEVREIMLKQFNQIFRKLESIPIAILCEPLLKQVSISQYHASSFNVFDFEFFTTVAHHKKLTLQTALMMTDTLTKIALSNVFYARVSITVLVTIMMRFSKAQEQLTHWRQSFRNIVTTLFNIELRKVQHKKALGKPEKKFYSKLAMKRQSDGKQADLEPTKLTNEELETLKLSERQIVNLLEKIIDTGNEIIAEELRLQLIDSFINLQQVAKEKSKALTYLLSKYGFQIATMIQERRKVTATEMPDQRTPLDSDKSPSKGRSNLLQARANQITNEADQDKAYLIDLKSLNTIKDKLVVGDQKTIEPAIYNPKDEIKLRQETQVSPKKPIRTPRAYSHKQNESRIQGRIAINKTRSQRSLKQTQDSQPQLYLIDQEETEIYVIRYRKLLKKRQGLYKALFLKFAGEDESKRIGKSLAIDLKTFEDYSRNNSIITVSGLIRLVQALEMDNQKATKLLRDEITNITKLINLNIFKKSRVQNLNELEYEGFMEFLLQMSHVVFNTSVDDDSKKYALKAFQLQEQLYNRIKLTNLKKLGLPRRYFDVAQDDQEILDALADKVNSNPQYQLPQGYTKLQVTEIHDVYEVPDALNLPESYKVSLEILDKLISDLFQVHVITPTPVLRTQWRVKADKNSQAFQLLALRASEQRKATQSPNLQDKKKQLVRQSHNTVNLASPQSNAQLKKAIKSPASTDKYTTMFYSETRSSNLTKSQKRLPAMLQLAIIDAPYQDRQMMAEVAQILNEVLSTVEANAQLQDSTELPRHMQKYVSRKTLRKQQEEQYIRQMSQEMQDATKQQRSKSLKRSMVDQEKFIKQQIEKVRAEKEAKLEQEFQEKLGREKKEAARKEKLAKVKEQLKTREEQDKEKIEQERLAKAEEAKIKEEQAKQEFKLLVQRRKLFAKEQEIKAQERKEKEAKEKADKEERDKAARKEQAIKIAEIIKKRQELTQQKQIEREKQKASTKEKNKPVKTEDAKSRDPSKKSERNPIKKSELELSKNSEPDLSKKLEPKLSKERTANTRRSQATVGSGREETGLAKVEPLLREESMTTEQKPKNVLQDSYEGLSTIGLDLKE